jgi:integrase
MSYGQEHAPGVASPDAIAYALPRLAEYWAGKTVAEITPRECKNYVKWRTAQPIATFKCINKVRTVSSATARRELGVLAASIGHAWKERRLKYRISVALPKKPPARNRYLSRSEVAALLRAARRNTHAKHLARFILIGLYTGTRHKAILRLRWLPNIAGGWVDLDRKLIHRRSQRETETDKRRPPVAISNRLAAHLKRWQGQGSFVIEHDGEPLLSIRKAWATARASAKLGPDVTPHTLRHTFASWAVQSKKPFSEVAEALGTTEAIVRMVYGHLDPDYTRDVVEAVSGKVSGKREKANSLKH